MQFLQGPRDERSAEYASLTQHEFASLVNTTAEQASHPIAECAWKKRLDVDDGSQLLALISDKMCIHNTA